jgi:SAM-dependent methyltransferase
VILMAALEHVQDADRTFTEMRRVLAPGGRVLIDVPFIQGYHASPADHRRYTEQGLRAELERYGFEPEASGVAVGPASAMAWVGAEFLALLLSFQSARAYRFLKLATTLISWPIKFADLWLTGHPMAYTIASAVWATGRLPEERVDPVARQ